MGESGSKGQRVAPQCLSLLTGSPAPGHDGRVENAVSAPDTRHLHNQWYSKELMEVLGVGQVGVLHLTNT